MRRSVLEDVFGSAAQASRKVRKKARRRTRALRLESLEDRALLAADVFFNDNWNMIVDNNAPGLDVGDIVDGGNDGLPGVSGAYGVDAFGAVTSGLDTGSLAGSNTLNNAVAATPLNGMLEVLPGTYNENVLVNKNISLVSTGGRAVTTIQGVSGIGSLGAIQVTNNTTGVQIGDTGQGFSIIGIDNGAPGIENAAIYFQGSHSNAVIRDNEIVANGEAGLLTEFGATISGFVIDGNEFSGQTFLGAQPAGIGFGTQFTQPNVPRQLVAMGGGTGGGNTSNITFTNNDITGTTGGISTDDNVSEQGNTLVTIDSVGATVTGNTFAGTTARFGSSLRVRGTATDVSGNDFDSSGQSPTTNFIFVGNNATSPDTLPDVVANNMFDGGGAIALGDTIFLGGSLQDLINAAPAGSTLNLAPGTYSGVTINKDLTLDGGGGGVFIEGASPALTVTSGQVVVQNGVTFGVSTDDRTVVVESGGDLTISDVTVNESDGFDQVGVFVESGGVLDVSSADNTLNVRGAGQLLQWEDASPLNLIGNTLQQDGGAFADDFDVEDAITHALDNASFGLATWSAGNVFVTTNTLGIQRGVDAATASDTVNVADGAYAENVTVDKALTIDGESKAGTIVDPGAGNVFVLTTGDVTIQDLTIQNGSQGARIDLFNGGLGGAADNVVIDNVDFFNLSSRGIEVHNLTTVTNFRLLNSQLVNTGTGMRLSSSAVGDGIEIDNTLFDGGSLGFYQANDGGTGNVRDVTITNSEFTNFTDTAVFAEEIRESLIDGNNFHDNRRGITVFKNYTTAGVNVSDVTISNNQFTDHENSSILYYQDNSGLAGPVNIFGNTINQDVGVLAANWASIDIRLAAGFSHGPVNIDGNSVTLSGVFGAAMAAYAVQIRGASDDIHITNNTLDGGAVGSAAGVPPTSGVFVRTDDAGMGAISATAEVDIRNNFIRNFDNGVSVYDTEGAAFGNLTAGAALNINGNSLTGNLLGVASGAGETVDASGNWWGTNTEGGVQALTTGPVDFTPFLDDGSDTNGMAGFQGDFSTLHVTALGEQFGPQGRISEGVDLVTNSTIFVGAGTYQDNVILDKQVNLFGAQAGVDARGRGGMQSIINTAGAPGTGTLIELQAGSAGSVIDGFTFGDSSHGIDSTSGPIDNLQILNNVFNGFTGAGVFLDDPGEDITVHQNVIDGTNQVGGGGIFHLDQDDFDGFHFTSNWVLDGDTGFFVDGNHNVGGSVARDPLFQDNLFDGNGAGMNAGRFAIENATIMLNVFSNNAFDGLQGGVQNSLITMNNFVDNDRAGLRLTGFGGTGDPTRGAQDNTITQNYFSGNGAGMSAAGHGDVRIDDQFDGTQSTNLFFDNSFNSAATVFNNETSGEIIDFSGNYWGTNDSAALQASILGVGAGAIDFSPWLDSGANSKPPLPPAVETSTFEQPGFTVGESIQAHGLDGNEISPIVSGTNTNAVAWSIRAATTDEEVVDTGDLSHGKAWRLSDLGDTGNLQTRPHSPKFDGQAGETGAIDDFGGDPVTTASIVLSYDFRSATGAAQAGLQINTHLACGDDCRHGFIRIRDEGDGFDLEFFDTGVGGFSEFQSTILDTNLSYTDWHNIVIEIQFVDGLNGDGTGNDIVSVFVDGALAHTGTSWETGYDDVGTGDPRSVDRAAFYRASSGAADPSGGLWFDNVYVGETLPIAPGFAGDFSVLHVDDDSPVASTSAAPGRIQEAIELVTASEVIVHDGTYDEDVQVNINDLNLHSVNGAAVTTINGQTNADGAIRTIDGLQNLTLGGAGIGFTVNARTDPGDALHLFANNSGHWIEDNVFNSVHVSGQNSAVETRGGQSNHTFQNNTFAGSATQLVYIGGVASHGLPGASANVDFLGNQFTGSATGPLLGQEADGSEITGNQFTGATTYAAIELFGQNNAISDNALTGTGSGVGVLINNQALGTVIDDSVGANAISGYDTGVLIRTLSATVTGNDFTGGNVDSDVHVEGTGGIDNVSVSPTSVDFGSFNVAIDGTVGVAKVSGFNDEDVFDVAPSLNTVFKIDGGLPSAPAIPGDTLNYMTPMGEISTNTPGAPGSGTISATGGYQDVLYSEIESFSFSGDIAVNGTAGDDTLVIIAASSDAGTYQLITDGVAGPVVNISSVTSFTFNGLDGDDILRINNPGGGLFDPMDGVVYDGGDFGEGNTPAMGDNPTGDGLEILGGMAATSVEHVFANNHDGSVRYDLEGTATITYT
ncbi:MAG: right-handed parallel beta-helix repeat-containing protein, partial [Pirellulaceae bacterium]